MEDQILNHDTKVVTLDNTCCNYKTKRKTNHSEIISLDHYDHNYRRQVAMTRHKQTNSRIIVNNSNELLLNPDFLHPGCRKTYSRNHLKLHNNCKNITIQYDRYNNLRKTNIARQSSILSRKTLLHHITTIAIFAFIIAFITTNYQVLAYSSDDYYGDCNESLLSKARLFASSEQTRDRGASAAQLNSNSAWTAGQSDFAQYLTIDLGKKMNVTSISSQGRAYSSEFVMEYRIDYGYDGQDFAPYRDRNGNIKIFEANMDDRSIVENRLESPLVAQYLRINPTRWHNRISMRIDIHGCQYTSEILSFDGQSIVLMNLRRRTINSIEGHLQFRFRTPNADATLLYATGEEGDMMALQLINNKLVYSADLAASGRVQNVSAGSLLDDNTWHDVSLDYHGRDVILSVDRVVVKKHFKGDFERLNLNLDLWIGGLPMMLQYNTIGVSQNFTGCLENLTLNTTSIATELAEDTNGFLYTIFGYIYRDCALKASQSVTFLSNESYFRIEGYQQPVMNCSLDFRTFIDNGVLLYSKFSIGGIFTISLKDGKLLVSLQGDQGPRVDIEPNESSLLNDGSWHGIRLLARENLIMLQVDDQVSITKRKFHFESGREYFLGGSPEAGRAGLIGCMRDVYIEGRYLTLNSISPDRMFRNQPRDIILEACQMIDRCHPNPCEHNGICRQNYQEFTCDCSQTGYLGAVCHVSKHPPTCEAYRIDFPREKEKDILLDVDGSGPLEPFLVHCKFPPKGPTQTILHHRSESDIIVQGYEGRGSYVRSIDYYASWESMKIIIDRSASCSQNIKFTSQNNAQLFGSNFKNNNKVFDPFSWFVGANNEKADFWGGSIPGTGLCACGLDGTCRDPTKGCNSDAIISGNNYISQQQQQQQQQAELSDEGLITQKDYLPVREVHIGDTGSSSSAAAALNAFQMNSLQNSMQKTAKVNLGPLICEGDSLFNEAITFKYEDAVISLPNLVLGDAIDIYLQFKTTIQAAVLMHGAGLNEDFKLSLIGEKIVQFRSANGRDLQPLTVEAPYRLNDNQWHSVLIERNKREIRLVVDGQISTNSPARNNLLMGGQSQLMQTSQRSNSIQAGTTHLSLGATEDFKEGFVGCMRSLLINGKFIDIYKNARQGQYGLLMGCHGKCESNPCLNKGICKEGYSHYVCDCQWTAYKGLICADEIGANFRSENYVRYDFDTSLSTVEEQIRVGFTTTEHKGLILGITSHSGEYMNLLMSTSGHLKLEFDFGFERKEEVLGDENFALGQHHDIMIKRVLNGSQLIVIADNYEPRVFTYKVGKGADIKFDQLKSIYIGRNETMDSGDGFVGCISHVSFDDHFPLRFLFQENRKSNVHAYPPDSTDSNSPMAIMEDTCGIEPIRPPQEKRETRPSSGQANSSSLSELTGSQLTSWQFFLFLIKLLLALAIFGFLSGLCFVYIRSKASNSGDYVTHEDIGAKQAVDPDNAVMMGVTGPIISKKQEYFI